MAEYVLENNILKVTVDSKGCEIRDVLCKTDNTHRMWNANPEGWKRVAPVLFPLIGKYKDNQSIYNGKVYEMGQHGFARDMEFTLVKHNDGMLVKRNILLILHWSWSITLLTMRLKKYTE